MPVALLVAALIGAGTAAQAQDQDQTQAQTRDPVVHAVLFFSPTCPHCERVITDHLIPMQQRYGDRLSILALNTSTEYGVALFRAAMAHYGIPERDWAVPFMIVGDEILAGGNEIPARLGDLTKSALEAQGIDLPPFPALLAFLDQQGALLTLRPGPRYLYRNPSAAADPDIESAARSESHPVDAPEAQDETAPDSQATAEPDGPVVAGPDTVAETERSVTTDRADVPARRAPGTATETEQPSVTGEPPRGDAVEGGGAVDGIEAPPLTFPAGP